MTLLRAKEKMNISKDYEIDYARIGIDDIYVINEKGYPTELQFNEPVGHYTISPRALYAGREYTLGIHVNYIDLKGKLDILGCNITNAHIINPPVFDAELDLIVLRVKFKESVIPVLNELSLPEPLWTICSLQLTINDQVVSITENSHLNIPVSFGINGTTPTGEHFYNSDKAFMTVQPGETIYLDLTSGAGAGAGVNLIKGENKSGTNGGDATLCYLEPETGEIKPIVFLEGGFGGRLSTGALQEFKERKAKTKVFCQNSNIWCIKIETLIQEHALPTQGLTTTDGGEGYLLPTGGKGGIKDEVGYRGEGGMSGARALVCIKYNPGFELPGPFIILHPRTMVNIFNVIDDKDLKIKKTKIPMIGGTGGTSLTESGTDGQSGNLKVSIQ